MNASDELRQVLAARMHGDKEKYYAVLLWEQEVKAFCTDMDACLGFIRNICTDEELYWLGEVYDDIAEQTHSLEFLQCLRERALRVENSEWKDEIMRDIATAAEYIEASKDIAQKTEPNAQHE